MLFVGLDMGSQFSTRAREKDWLYQKARQNKNKIIIGLYLNGADIRVQRYGTLTSGLQQVRVHTSRLLQGGVPRFSRRYRIGVYHGKPDIASWPP